MTTEIEKLKSTNRILIVVLIIAAFFLGSLTNKVATLEKGTSGNDPAALPQQQANAPKRKTEPAKASDKLKPLSASDHVKGNANAKIVLIEYSDFECPFCRNFEPTVKQIMEKYGNKIKLALRHFPLPFHPNAQKLAEASECVAELGGNDAFWKYTDNVFGRNDGIPLTSDKLTPIAEEVGVNSVQFQSCLDSGKYEKLVKDSIAEGQTAGVGGTPSTFINGKIIVGACPLATFESVIQAESDGKPWSVENCQINLTF